MIAFFGWRAVKSRNSKFELKMPVSGFEIVGAEVTRWRASGFRGNPPPHIGGYTENEIAKPLPGTG